MFNIAALFIGAMVLKEGIGTGELVIGPLERTEVASFKPWTTKMMDCMYGCLDRNLKCKESCKTDERIEDCLEKKCVDGILLCREFCDMVYNDDSLKRWPF